MKGLWLEEQHLQLRQDLPVPEPPPGEARVRVLQAGICNTDLELVRGYYPYVGILGHEFVGIVDQGPEAWRGKRVVGDINASCDACSTCKAGGHHHCPHRSVLGIVERHGAFAEFLCLPVRNLYEVPATVSNDAATFTEPLAAALEIQQQLSIGASQRVVVVGDGKLGNLVAQSLALTGCDLLVCGRHDSKLRLLEERGIATSKATDLPKRDFDVAVECTGNPQGFDLALQALRPCGTLVLKSTYAGALQVNAADLVVNEIQVIGSRCGPFAPALQLLADKHVDVTPLIAGRYALQEGLQAFKAAQSPGTLKVLLQASGGATPAATP